MQDFAARMKEIKAALERDDDGGGSGGSTSAANDTGGLEEKEALLDELMDIVASIDYARGACVLGGRGDRGWGSHMRGMGGGRGHEQVGATARESTARVSA